MIPSPAKTAPGPPATERERATREAPERERATREAPERERSRAAPESERPASRERPARRMTADERREEILEAAIAEFAAGGLHGTSTETIAERAGISQPYLFRLFGTKKDLFLAGYLRCCEQVLEAFRTAAGTVPAGAAPEERLRAMGGAYHELIRNRDLMRMQMQGYVAAAGDEEIRAAARRRYAELFRFVEDASGADPESVLAFFATGMLLNVSAALGLPARKPGEYESWAASFRRGR
jgi:AcrR family transcriptional regulator